MLLLRIVLLQGYYRLHYFNFKMKALSREGNKLGKTGGLLSKVTVSRDKQKHVEVK
jgi:hypothetical protein